MKILGKRSLSSIIEKFLVILLILCVIAIISGAIIISINSNILFNLNIFKTLVTIYLSSIPGLILIYQFIKIFRSLKNEKVFDKENVRSLKNGYIISIIIGAMYLLNSIELIFTNTKKEVLSVYLLLMFIISMVFIIFGIGLIVLSEIYKKAIEYKEENDLTI